MDTPSSSSLGKWLARHFPGCPTMVLSVRESVDRRQQTERELIAHDIVPQFHIVDRHPTNGALGCLDGHLEIIEHAKQQGWSMVLIMEDDIEILGNTGNTGLSIPDDWCMMYLGGHCHDADRRPRDATDPGLLRVRDTLTTHAYLVRSTLYDTILDQRWIHHCAEFSTLRADSMQQLQYPLSKTYWSPLRLMHFNRHPFSSQVDWSKRAIDIFYAHYIQPHHPTYMVYPLMVGQRAGTSLIESHQQTVDYTPLMTWKADVLAHDRMVVTLVMAIEPTGHTWEVVADYIRHIMFPSQPIHLILSWISRSPTSSSLLVKYDTFTYGMSYQSMSTQLGWNDHLIVTHELFRLGSRGLSLVDLSEAVARRLWILDQPWIDCSFMTPTPDLVAPPVVYRTHHVVHWTYDLAWFPLSWIHRFPCREQCVRLHEPVSLSIHHPLPLLHFLLTYWKEKRQVVSQSIVSVISCPVIPTSAWSLLTWKPATFRPPLLTQLRQRLVHQLTTGRPREFDSLVAPSEHLTP